jgi:hypothetical protein
VWWVVPTALLAAVVPWTLAVVFRTNARLFDDGADSEEVASSLGRWQVLHGVRTLLGGCAFGTMVALAVPA